MIEIIYDETNESAGAASAGRGRYELPKNIRQVGNAPGNYKIYVEDYVMTYLRKIASPGNMNCRGAILLGKIYDDEQGKVIFVSGAVDAQNLEFDISMIHFGDSVWSSIYSEINKYFDDLAIVGWFLSRMGFSALINDQMKKLHRDNFPGEDKLLFLMDSLECDEAFYYYQHGNWMREKGYYIYYVRNEKMQNYIISRKSSSSEPAQDNVLLKDKTVVENFRQKDKTREPVGRRTRVGEAAACFAVVCALAAGALWYISPETVNKIGDKISGGKGQGEVQVFMNSGHTSGSVESDVKNDAANGADGASEALSAEKKPSTSASDNTLTADADITETAAETADHADENTLSEVMTDEAGTDDAGTDGAGADGAGTDGAENGVSEIGQTDDTYDQAQTDLADAGEDIYVVQAGDTLVSIAIKLYGDVENVEEIAAANGLGIDDPIYEGQKLVIPNVD